MSLITYNGESKVIKRICELLDTMSGINFEVVQTLPLVDISTSTIYLVPKQSAEVDNIYDEYINTDGTSQGWELIGTTEIDLTNYVQFSDLSTVATSGDYDDLIDKPTIPTVNDGTLTIQLNGENQQTFTANSSTNKTANIKAVDWVSNGKIGAKNLNSYPYYETTHSEANIAWTDNGDGTVTANNTSTGTSAFICHSRVAGRTNPLILPNGKYILSGCPSGGSDNTYRVIVYVTKNGSASTLGVDYGEGAIIEVNGDDNYNDKALVQIGCDIRKTGFVANNLTFNPMIRLATDSDSTWQLYSMTNQELTKKARWINLGSQNGSSEITITEPYSELMITVDFGADGDIVPIHILRDMLTTTSQVFTVGNIVNSNTFNSLQVTAYLSGTSIKLQAQGEVIGSGASRIVNYKLYAKY